MSFIDLLLFAGVRVGWLGLVGAPEGAMLCRMGRKASRLPALPPSMRGHWPRSGCTFGASLRAGLGSHHVLAHRQVCQNPLRPRARSRVFTLHLDALP